MYIFNIKEEVMKKLCSFMICIFLCAFALCACRTSDTPVKPDGGDSNMIFSSNTRVQIICNDLTSAHLPPVFEKVDSIIDYFPNVSDDSAEIAEHEIVIGETSRPISQKAYRLLDRMEHESESDVGYLIYSDGASVAIAYDEDIYGLSSAGAAAADCFVNEVIGDKTALSLPEGTVAKDSFDALICVKAADAAARDAKWQETVEYLNSQGADGEAIVEAVKHYYSTVSTKNVLSWLANLYEPAIGGFYYSNSARDTLGFLPDAESTSQALDIIKGSGLADSKDGKIIDTIPDGMRKEIIAFLKGLQDPETGYFYHPQWSKEDVNAHLSRRSRDLTKSVATLELLGSAPTYDTPSGEKGDGILPDGTKADVRSVSYEEHLTSSLVRSGPATSEVIQAAASYGHLENETTFKAYLAELERLNALPKSDPSYCSFYSIGNEVGSQALEIKTRDAALKEEGAKYSLCDILLEWFEKHQDKTTGLWDEGICYDSTNALLKIMPTYNKFERPFPNAVLAAESCVKMLSSSEEVKTVCYAYNVWMALDQIITNLTKYSQGDVGEMAVSELRKTILEMAPEAILLTAEKQLTFKKEDGSFSFNPDRTSTTSQGLPVAVANTNEGDVNATVICMNSTISYCLSVLGIKYIAPSIFGEAERLEFNSMINALGPVIKDDEVVYDDPITFDDSQQLPEGVSISSLASSGGRIEVIDDPRALGKGAVLELHSTNDGYDRVLFSYTGLDTPDMTCYVFGADLCFKSSDEGYSVQMMMGNCYMLTFTVKAGTVNIWDSSSGSGSVFTERELGITPAVGEWFNLKVEYYYGDHDTVRIKVYFNGKLAAVSDNYYDVNGVKLTKGYGTPSANFTNTRIAVISNKSATVLMDDVLIYKSRGVYKPYEGADLAVNADEAVAEQRLHDFENAESVSDLPSDISIVGDAEILKKEFGGKIRGVLALNPLGDTVSEIKISAVSRNKRSDCFVAESTFVMDSGFKGGELRMRLREDNSRANTVTDFILEITAGSGCSFVNVKPNPNGKTSGKITGFPVEVKDGFVLRTEYFEDERVTYFYVDGMRVGESKAVCDKANLYFAEILDLTATSPCEGLYVDSIVAERLSKLGTGDAVHENTVHTFDTGLPIVVTLMGGATLEASSDGNAILLDKEGEAIAVNLVKKSEFSNVIAFSAELDAKSVSGENVFTLTIYNDKDKILYCFDIKVADSYVEVYEITEKKSYVTPLIRIERDDAFELGFELYARNDNLCFVHQNKYIANTSLRYGEEFDCDDVKYITVTAKKSSDKTYVDNIVFESYRKIYREPNIISENSEDESAALTFEDSSTGNLPGTVTKSLSSLGSYVRVKEVLKRKALTKAVVYNSTSGANDSLIISPTNTLEKFDTLSFEADMMIEPAAENTASYYQLMFRNGTTVGYNIMLGYTADGNIVVCDTSSKGGLSSKVIASAGEWFRIRLDYFNKDDGTAAIKIYVNEIYLCEANLKSNGSVSVQSINNLRIYTYSALEATMTLDDLSFVQLDAKDDSVTPEPKPDPTPNPKPEPEEPTPDTSGENIFGGEDKTGDGWTSS